MNAQIDRLRTAARDALIAYTKACMAGNPPEFPQWAKDALDACHSADGKRAYTNVGLAALARVELLT